MKFTKKASLLLAGALFCVATTATAQSKFYVGAQVGYGFPASGDVLGTDRTDTHAENIYGSIGGGFTAGVNVGYNITSFLSFDLGAQYLVGSQITENKYEGAGGRLEEKMSTNQVRLIPSLVVKGGEGAVKPFARFGLIIPVAGSTTREHSSYSPTSLVPVPGAMLDQTYTYEFKGAPSLGFDAGVGVAYDLSENISLTAEINYTALRIKTKTGEMTEYAGAIMVDGTNMGNVTMTTLPTIKKEMNFVDELTATSNNASVNNNIDANKAEDVLAKRTNFNAVSLKLGVKYSF